MTQITDYTEYNAAMKRAMNDKLFFVSHINPSMIVDFGCADGSMMQNMREFYPNTPIIGVDNDPQMRDTVTNFEVLPDLADVKVQPNSALVLSSVLHELYSYSTPEDITKFWKYASQFQYIVIRDMCLSSLDWWYPAPADSIDVVRTQFPEQVKDFEKQWGHISLNKNFFHFLLKYKYQENWERELKEDYLINTTEGITRMATVGRSVMYKHSFTLPYLRDMWKRDIGVSIDTNTHLKMIVTNNH